MGRTAVIDLRRAGTVFREIRDAPWNSASTRYGGGLVVLHAVFMTVSYLLAYLGAGGFSDRDPSPTVMEQTLPVFLALSVLISVLLFLARSDYVVVILILLRFYLVAVQGYGVGSFFFLKLLLGWGLIFETILFLHRPLNLILVVPVIAGLLGAQLYNPILGHYGRQVEEAFASWRELGVLAFIWGTSAVLLGLATAMAEDIEKYKKSFLTQKEGMQILTDLNVDLQSYARKIDHESSERERNRISRELHDISGYIFTNLIVLLDAACSIPSENVNELSDILITARKEARQGLQETRSALRKIRAVRMPEEEGLRAINTIITNFRNVTGIEVTVSWGNAPSSFTTEINSVLYRTVQEALTNAFKHGMATEISIHFLIVERRIRLIIADNGKGATEVVKGIGLSGMEERIGALGGCVETSVNAEGKGFTLKVEIPLGGKGEPGDDGEAGILRE